MPNDIVYFNFASGDMTPAYAESNGDETKPYADIDTIIWNINHNHSAPMFRIYVLYPDETIAYEIPEAFIQSGGSYQENYQNGSRRTLSFTLYNQDGRFTPTINSTWAGTRLRLDVGLKINNALTYWFKKGVFVITNASASLSPGSRTVQIQATDKFNVFEGATGKLQSTYEIKTNIDIQQIVYDIQHTSMENGYTLDPTPMIFHSKLIGKDTQVAISKNAGDTLGSIITDLATQLSAETFYNANGNLVFIPINDVTNDIDKPLLYNFDTANGDISALDFSFDYSSIINNIIVVGTSTSGGTFYAEAKNNDAASPLSVQRIGIRTGDIINDSNIYSKDLAQDRADYELRQKLVLKSSTSADISFNPLLEVNNLITISDEFYGLSGVRFLIQSLSFSLDKSNKMTISFSNLNNLPFITK